MTYVSPTFEGPCVVCGKVVRRTKTGYVRPIMMAPRHKPPTDRPDAVDYFKPGWCRGSGMLFNAERTGG